MIALLEQKTLPHSEESERAVLAAILLDPTRHLPTTSGRLRAEDFYLERHQRLFQAMLELQAAKVEIDVRTLQAHLEQQKLLQEVGGLAYIATLEVDLPDLGRVEHYVEIVKERSLRRRLIAASADIYRNCQDGGLEAKQALDRAEQAILELGEEATPRGFMALGDAIKGTVYELEERPDEVMTGLKSGFDDWDALTHGLNPGNLIIIAGRPGMGKSSFVTCVAQAVALHLGKAVGIFSLEMSVNEIAMRILASESEVPLRKRRPSDRDWERIHRAARRTAEAGIFIDDSASPTLLEVASKSRRLKFEKGLDLLIVDYLQLMQAGGRYENRNLEIGAITRGLKGLAKELAIPVIALSQLSRQPERRGSDHRPQLADLRESGCLTGDTLVALAESGARIPIRDLIGRRGFSVWALDQGKLRIDRAEASRAFSTGAKPVYRMTTRLGRTIRATANHKFLTVDGWKRLDELSAGSHLAAYKKACLSDALAWLGSRAENTNRDVIPRAVWDTHVRPAMKANGVTHRRLHAEIGTAYAGQTTFRKNLSRERALLVARAAGAELLRLLAESDIYWDQVASIKPDGVEEVFDLTVPGPHNFIANDLFVHNSIEQDADVVAFIYRDEIYNPENEESQGLAELIVAKNRNGQTGTVDLAFFGETTTFRSLARRSPG